MNVDFEMVRSFIGRTESDCPFEIGPPLMMIDFGEDGGATIHTPIGDGIELKHWRRMHEEKLIRVEHEGKPGFGRMKSEVVGLRSKGQRLLELSRDEQSWKRSVDKCKAAGAMTLSVLMSELRQEARIRVKRLNHED